MTIKLPDPGNGIPEQKTGNDEWTNMKIVRDNFADSSNAASRVVGRSAANVVEFNPANQAGTPTIAGSGIAGNAGQITMTDSQFKTLLLEAGSGVYRNSIDTTLTTGYNTAFFMLAADTFGIISTDQDGSVYFVSGGVDLGTKQFTKINRHLVRTSKNTFVDGNGFVKQSSPIVAMYDGEVVLNADAEKQNITFTKNGKGDYTLKTKTGLRSDNTWRIEIPNDDNRNPLFAVNIDAKDDGTINIKCYKRIFNMQTFMFEPDLDSPVDITEGRFISVRLNDNPEPEQTDEPVI